jgi:hypothetical protein
MKKILVGGFDRFDGHVEPLSRHLSCEAKPDGTQFDPSECAGR